jgi:protein TonB
MLSAANADPASMEFSLARHEAPGAVQQVDGWPREKPLPDDQSAPHAMAWPVRGAIRVAGREPIKRWAILLSLALHVSAVTLLAVGSTPRRLVAVTSATTQATLADRRVSVELLERRAPLPPVPAMPVAPRRQPAPVLTKVTPMSQAAVVATAAPAAAESPPAPAAPTPLTPAAPPDAEAVASEHQMAVAPRDASPAERREQQEYVRALMAWLLRHCVYPDAAKKEKVQGIVHVRFTIDREGRVLSAQVERSPGHPLLDGAALDVLARASPLPAIPASMPMRRLTITLPIEYALRTD